MSSVSLICNGIKVISLQNGPEARNPEKIPTERRIKISEEMAVAGLPDLSNYLITGRETPNCYLDGRYFDLVFRNVQGYDPRPLVITHTIVDKPGEKIIEVFSDVAGTLNLSQSQRMIRRVILQDQVVDHSKTGTDREVVVGRHSAVLYSDPALKYVYLVSSPGMKHLKKILKKEIKKLVMATSYVLFKACPKVPEIKRVGCEYSGYCVAYSIYFAYSFLVGRSEFATLDILRFAGLIESMYGPLAGEPDVEFGPSYGPGYNGNSYLPSLAVGALTGAALGAAATGLGGYSYPYGYPYGATPYGYPGYGYPGYGYGYPGYGGGWGRGYGGGWGGGYGGRDWDRDGHHGGYGGGSHHSR